MTLYELIGFSEQTIMELGRFRSDEEAINATKKIILPPGSCFLATRSRVVVRKVLPVRAARKMSREEIMERLARMCLTSPDPAISGMAYEYREFQ